MALGTLGSVTVALLIGSVSAELTTLLAFTAVGVLSVVLLGSLAMRWRIRRCATPDLPSPRVGASSGVVTETSLLAAGRLGDPRHRHQELEAARRELVAAVSHDLRTPLTSIRIIAEAFDAGLLSDPDVRRAYLQSLRANVERMTDMVDTLFESSQLDGGLLELRRESVSLVDLVLDLLLRFEAHAATAGVRLEAEIGQPGVMTHGDPSRISRILDNVVHNGILHTPCGGTVRVVVEDDAATALVRVQDGCGGIPDSDLGRLFDRLWRGEPARVGAGSGLGLGLTIAAAFAEMHGGRLTASNRHPGCEFRLELPSSAN